MRPAAKLAAGFLDDMRRVDAQMLATKGAPVLADVYAHAAAGHLG